MKSVHIKASCYNSQQCCAHSPVTVVTVHSYNHKQQCCVQLSYLLQLPAVLCTFCADSPVTVCILSWPVNNTPLFTVHSTSDSSHCTLENLHCCVKITLHDVKLTLHWLIITAQCQINTAQCQIYN